MSLEVNELFKEKTPWHILWQCHKIRLSRLNFVVLSLVVITTGYFGITCTDTQYLVRLTRDLAKYWLPIGLSTLGFLISGFAVYTALGKPSLFLKMAETKHEPTGLSWLKYVLFVFMEVLMFYVLFSVFCMLIIVFCDAGGIVPQLISRFSGCGALRHHLAAGSFWAVSVGMVWSVLLLPSYIYNIYGSVLTCVKWGDNAAAAQTKNPPSNSNS